MVKTYNDSMLTKHGLHFHIDRLLCEIAVSKISFLFNEVMGG